MVRPIFRLHQVAVITPCISSSASTTSMISMSLIYGADRQPILQAAPARGCHDRKRSFRPDVAIDRMIDLMLQWQPLCWAQEKGVLDRALGPFLVKRLNERKAYFHTAKFPCTADKMTRAQSILGRISMSKVHFPGHADWWPALQSEMVKFPLGLHDDQVDALSLIGRMLAGMIRGTLPPAPPEPGRMLTVGGKPTAGYNLMSLNDLYGGTEQDIVRPRRRRRR